VAWPQLEVAELAFRLLNDPLETPVRTSFGTMTSRPGLLVRLRDESGHHGYGEIWCNFPRGGARYKATLLVDGAAALVGQRFDSPHQVQAMMRRHLAVLALQCADHGSVEQLLAGLDQAAWDLFTKALGEPFWRLLGGDSCVAVYASGIGPRGVEAMIRAQSAAGHRRFKIKIGFDEDTDRANVDAARAALPEAAWLAVDVNQAWTVPQALQALPELAARDLVWCEEPVAADVPWSAWRRLSAAAGGMRLAAGENLLGHARFARAVTAGGVRVLQPDLGKWGGVSGALQLRAGWPGADAWLCPHWLAGGVGLMASLQLKAVTGGAGAVEVDANPNRQRTEAFATPLVVTGGAIELPDCHGLIPPLADWLADPAAWMTRLA
jgi:L-alanine-DL-glutamate epimerase-like enolase superfamily enzyme